MNVLVSDEHGSFVAREVAQPQAATGELLIRVSAASVGPRDLRMAKLRAGFRPGSDFAGVVESAAGRSGPQAGERIIGVIPGGAWSELLAVPARAVCKLPEAVDFASAAAIAGSGLTALYAIERCGTLLGKRVLITGAGGSVGYVACQIALLAGARVTGWVRAHDVEAQMPDGAALVVGGCVTAAAPNGPFDVAIDVVGGKTLTEILGLMTPGGRIVIVGAASGEKSQIDAATIYQGTIDIAGFGLFPELSIKPASTGLERLFDLVERNLVNGPKPDVRPALLPGALSEPARGSRIVLEFTASERSDDV